MVVEYENITQLQPTAYKTYAGPGYLAATEAAKVAKERGGTDIDEKQKTALEYLQAKAQYGQPTGAQALSAQAMDAARAKYAGAGTPEQQRAAMLQQSAAQAYSAPTAAAAAAKEMQGQQGTYITAQQGVRAQELKDTIAQETLAQQYMAMGLAEKDADLAAQIQYERDKMSASGLRSGAALYESSLDQQMFSAIMGGIGSAMSAAGAGSDVNAKEDIRPSKDVLSMLSR